MTKRKNTRKSLIGSVVAKNSLKTVMVEVVSYKKHPLYHKRFKITKKFPTHDDQDKVVIGDKVKITETRPYSKTKHFRIAEILNKVQ